MFKTKNQDVIYRLLFVVFSGMLFIYIFDYKNIIDIIYVFISGIFILKCILEFK